MTEGMRPWEMTGSEAEGFYSGKNHFTDIDNNEI